MSGWEFKPYKWENTYGSFQLKYHNHILLQHNFDAIIIMAGGLNDTGFVHSWVKNRLDLALQYYNYKNIDILCTGGGTYHKPPILNKDKYVIHEATACADYLMNNGVKSDHIIKEWGSYDTIASVYFSLLLVVYENEWKNVCVISSDFHIERVKMIFEWINGMYDKKVNLIFKNTRDDIIEERRKREKESVKKMKKIIEKIKDRKEFNRWFYREHKAYACNYQNYKENINENEKKSY